MSTQMKHQNGSGKISSSKCGSQQVIVKKIVQKWFLKIGSSKVVSEKNSQKSVILILKCFFKKIKTGFL